jgi:hypothetical protein
MRWWRVAIALLALAGASDAAADGRLMDAVLAEIDSRPVMLSDVTLARALGVLGLEPAAGPITDADLARYLDAQLAVREASQLAIEVSSADVDRAWDLSGGAALASRLAAAGIEPAWARRLLEADLLVRFSQGRLRVGCPHLPPQLTQLQLRPRPNQKPAPLSVGDDFERKRSAAWHSSMQKTPRTDALPTDQGSIGSWRDNLQELLCGFTADAALTPDADVQHRNSRPERAWRWSAQGSPQCGWRSARSRLQPVHLGDAASSPATACDSFAEPNHRLRIQADTAAQSEDTISQPGADPARRAASSDNSVPTACASHPF